MTEITGSGLEALQRQVDSFSLREVVRVASDASIKQVARRMREEDVSSLLVGDRSREIVTERDLTRALADGLGPDDSVMAIAERTPLWVLTNSRIVDVAQMMLRHEVRHLIVLKETGEPAGIISMRDLFALLVPSVGMRAEGAESL